MNVTASNDAPVAHRLKRVISLPAPERPFPPPPRPGGQPGAIGDPPPVRGVRASSGGSRTLVSTPLTIATAPGRRGRRRRCGPASGRRRSRIRGRRASGWPTGRGTSRPGNPEPPAGLGPAGAGQGCPGGVASGPPNRETTALLRQHGPCRGRARGWPRPLTSPAATRPGRRAAADRQRSAGDSADPTPCRGTEGACGVVERPVPAANCPPPAPAVTLPVMPGTPTAPVGDVRSFHVPDLSRTRRPAAPRRPRPAGGLGRPTVRRTDRLGDEATAGTTLRGRRRGSADRDFPASRRWATCWGSPPGRCRRRRRPWPGADRRGVDAEAGLGRRRRTSPERSSGGSHSSVPGGRGYCRSRCGCSTPTGRPPGGAAGRRWTAARRAPRGRERSRGRRPGPGRARRRWRPSGPGPG